MRCLVVDNEFYITNFISVFPVDVVTLCMNSSYAQTFNAEGRINLSLPSYAEDRGQMEASPHNSSSCSFQLSSQSSSDRIILVLPNVKKSRHAACSESTAEDEVHLTLTRQITNEVQNDNSALVWDLCTTATTTTTTTSRGGNGTNNTVLNDESMAFQNMFFTAGSTVTVIFNYSSFFGNLDSFDGRDSISIYFKSFKSNDRLEEDLCLQCDQNDSWAWHAGICSDFALDCTTSTPEPTEKTNVLITCIPTDMAEKKKRSELYSIMMAGAIVITLLIVSVHCSASQGPATRRPAAMDIMLRDDISRRGGGGGMGGGRGPFGGGRKHGNGPIAHV
ncbi:uncharacterized protein [Diadema setosum]|uniref:uncharacterized protein n=1 Tax=Diadema setosum TaxID=31175 RepID=UPI003B3B9D03